MMPHVERGNNTYFLIKYLLGPGRENEHEHQRFITADVVTSARFKDRDFLNDETVAGQLATALDETWKLQGRPRIAYRGEQFPDGARVWHCSLSIHPEEGKLSDEMWGDIATAFMDEMGFDSLDDDRGSRVRWVAIHHGQSKKGNDHIHIAAVLACETGKRVNTHMDFPRAQKTCTLLEQRFGLEVLTSRLYDRGKPGKHAALYAKGRAAEQETIELIVRSALASAKDEKQFVHNLRDRGLLVKVRFGVGGKSVDGYSVRLANPRESSGFWFAGGKLAKDLTLPAIRHELGDSPEGRAKAMSAWLAQDRDRDRHGQTFNYEDFDRWYQWASATPHGRDGWAEVARTAAGLCAEIHRSTGDERSYFSDLALRFAEAASTPAYRRCPSTRPAQVPRPVVTPAMWRAAGRGQIARVQIQLARRMVRLASGLGSHAKGAGDWTLAKALARTVTVFHDAEDAHRGNQRKAIPRKERQHITTERRGHGPPRSPTR